MPPKTPMSHCGQMVANHILAKYTGSGDPSVCDALHCIDYFKSQYPDPDGLRALFIALDEKLNALEGDSSMDDQLC